MATSALSSTFTLTVSSDILVGSDDTHWGACGNGASVFSSNPAVSSDDTHW